MLRFGEYNRTTNPGLNYHLPYPVETVVVPSVTTENTIEIGSRGTSGSSSSNQLQTREGQMLTADRNIVDIDFAVQWKIDVTAPQDFLFNMRDPEVSIRAVAESAMREVIGRKNLDDILIASQDVLPPVPAEGDEIQEVQEVQAVRPEIEEEAKGVMQRIFDEYKAGVEITRINVTRRDVPQPVIDEFQDIASAKQNKVTLESRALGRRNQIIPEAKGEAAKMEQEALAYKAKVTADAQGDVARFNSIYEEYVQAKDVTKRRLYLETMEAVMKDMPKMIIDPSARGNGGAVQMLPVPSARPAATKGDQP